jgi:hypothetical protein
LKRKKAFLGCPMLQNGSNRKKREKREMFSLNNIDEFGENRLGL